MKVSQVRLGHATNSSSSHSIIITRDTSKIKERSEDTPGGFGWDSFILKSPEAKTNYFAALLKGSLEEQFSEDMADTIVKQLTGIDAKEHYVDHQSMVRFPLKKGRRTRTSLEYINRFSGVDFEFVKEFREFLLRNDVVIIGGNDNDENDDPLKQIPRGVEYEEFGYGAMDADNIQGNLISKKHGTHWVLYNPSSGAKVTFSFDPKSPPLEKGDTPDLIDCKITDYCESGCEWCYQGSTKKGKHADITAVTDLIYAAHKMNVLEIAYGGGEPTDHPGFGDILKNTYDQGITPNFSTRSFKWLEDVNLLNTVKETVGAIGFSISSVDDVRAVLHFSKKYGIEEQVTFHYVLGTAPDKELDRIISEVEGHDRHLLFLGYKKTNRGAKFTPHNNDNWLEYISRSWLSVGIDTMVANQYEKELKKKELSKISYYTKEGKFSMYYDAVQCIAAPFSYCTDPKLLSSYDDKKRTTNDLSDFLRKCFYGY